MAKLSNITTKEYGIWYFFRWITKQLWNEHPWAFVSAIFLATFYSAFSFVGTFGFSGILNVLSGDNASWAAVFPLLLIIILTDYFPQSIGYLEGVVSDLIHRRLRNRIEQETITKVTTLDIATIEQPEFQDLYYQARSKGINNIGRILDWMISLVGHIARIVISLAIVFSISKISLIIVTAASLPVYFYHRKVAKANALLSDSQAELERKANTKLDAFVEKEALLEVKFLNISKYFSEKIKNIRLLHNKEYYKVDMKYFPWYNLIALLPSIGIGISLYLVISQVIRGQMLLGTLTLLWSSLWSFTWAFQTILRSIGSLEDAKIQASKIISLLGMSSFIKNVDTGIIYPQGVAPKIELKNVSFIYPGTDRKVISNISCVIEPKSEVALVGLNGAGKTTLLRLFTRVYDPTEGEILINDIPLNTYNLDSWRQALGIMLQDYHVYSDESIEENISFNTTVNKELLEKVAAESGVSEYSTTYTEGMKQMIGREFQGGVELSKGQKQKLALGRILYRDAPLVILDEPTAAIDAISEDRIFKAIRNNHRYQTRIIISHKFSNVRDADQIILIKNGKIVEQGNHADLMKLNSEYAELFKIQAEGFKA